MEKPIDQNPMPEFHLFAPRVNPLELVAHGLVRAIRSVPELFKMHQLASHGDHLPSSVDEMLLGDEQLDLFTEQSDGRANDCMEAYQKTFRPEEL